MTALPAPSSTRNPDSTRPHHATASRAKSNEAGSTHHRMEGAALKAAKLVVALEGTWKKIVIISVWEDCHLVKVV